MARSSDSPESAAFPSLDSGLIDRHLRAGLQQRVLLPIYTAFPFPKRLQRYIFDYNTSTKKCKIF